ncbi:MAG: 4-hydroxythreonine-4-phosphate dehydrogenase PdxA [Clostridiaceae bacterium]|jgi:4-hydroxythreonine-4-phosphate dehydrogenase|nr:4-hydroxythreonine-4-phosphate dehydrogenase PdxA [Clostridiaceae bacterium]
MQEKIIGITMGDASGVGPEIIVKALSDAQIYDRCKPVVFGDRKPLLDAIHFTDSSLKLNVIEQPEDALSRFGVIDLIDFGIITAGKWQYKKVCKISGEASFQYILKSIEMALDNRIQAVVTGPINKESINLAGHHFSGHTEIFAHYTGCHEYAMMLISQSLKVIHVTTHVSLRQACDIILRNPNRIESTIRLAKLGMKQLGVDSPRIAVAGLNPHSSENELFGKEETESIIPAITNCFNQGIDVTGPIPPDTVFVKASAGLYDIVVAMYHDQGHIPIKLSGFRIDPETGQYTTMSGVNTSIGLPVIRTSVDHGTAFDIAGEGRASCNSMVEAIEMALLMAKNKDN